MHLGWERETDESICVFRKYLKQTPRTELNVYGLGYSIFSKYLKLELFWNVHV